MRRAVFLDRDGVINKVVLRDGKPYPPTSVASLELLPGVTKATQALHDAGWLLIVVTNQPDVARGITSLETVEAINNRIRACLPIHEIRCCYHDNDDGCICRKPSSGSFFSAASIHDIDLNASYMVGDRWVDMEAGYGAGCTNIFIDYGYEERRPLNFDHSVGSLMEATTIILGTKNEENR
jgi:D-glycero-D-manno-heptose 1,7-bisphosphate phosphatase